MDEEELLQLAMLLSLEDGGNKAEVSLLNASVEDPVEEQLITCENEILKDNEDYNYEYYGIEDDRQAYEDFHMSPLSNSIANILLGMENYEFENENLEANNYQLEDVLAEIYLPQPIEEEGEVDEFTKIMNLQNREITENDYSTLLNLNDIAPPVKFKRRKNMKDLIVKERYSSQFSFKECMICLDDFEEKKLVYLIPDCLHPFHPNCLRKWFEEKMECPICRIQISES